MTETVPKKSRLTRLISWIASHPGDATTLVVVLVSVVLVVFEVFGDAVPLAWVVAALVALASTLSISFVSDRQQQRRANEALGVIEAEVSALSRARSVREVGPKEIPQNLERMLDAANDWTFKGGSGRWQRSTVLPRLASITSRSVHYRMQLIDPFNEKLCAAYGQYRTIQRAATRPARPDSGRQIQLEVLACIYATAWYAKNSRLQPTVSLVNAFSPLRVDAGGDGLLVTVADLAQSALYAANNSWYYESIVDEFEQVEKHGGKLELPQGTTILQRNTGADAKRFFDAMLTVNSVSAPEALGSYTDAEWNKLVKLAFS